MIKPIKLTVISALITLILAFSVSCGSDENLPNHTHTEAVRIENETESTCINEGGYTEVVFCEECGEVISEIDYTTEKSEHKYLLCECSYCGDTLSSEGLLFERNYDGSYTVVGIGDCADSDIYIPSEYEGGEVMAIGDYAFYSSAITSVHLPISIRRIGDYAFAKCKSLKTFEVGEELSYIGEGAFSSSGSILKTKHEGGYYLGYEENPYVIFLDTVSSSAKVSIADGTVCIYERALETSETDNIVLPDSLVFIGKRAFSNMKNLTGIHIPESVIFIGEEAFALSPSLLEITVSEENFMYKSIDGALYTQNGKSLIQYPVASERTELIVDTGVERIEGYAFFGATKLKEVTLPDGLLDIGAFAFSGCSSLMALSVPDSISSIGDGAISNCGMLEYLEEGNAIFLGDSSNPHAVLVSMRDKSLTSYKIPDTTRVILANAFYNCSMLGKIEIPNSVRYVGTSAFQYCQSAETITIGARVTYIGASAFYGCTGFRNLVIPHEVTYIGPSAFRGCIKLRSVSMSKNVTELAESVFSYCERLTSFTVQEGVTKIGPYAFMFCTRLESVYLSSTVKTIGEEAFRECSKLSFISVPGSVKTIEAGAFRNCSALKTVMLGEGVEIIKDMAFAYCTSLVNINIPTGAVYVGDGAFEACGALNTSEYGGGLYLGNSEHPYLYLLGISSSTGSLTLHTDLAFIKSGLIKGVALNYNLYEGGLYLGCDGNPYFLFVGMADKTLEESKIHDSARMILEGAYEIDDSVSAVIIGEGVRYIGAYAFESLSSLVTVEFKNINGWQACDFYADERISLFGSSLSDKESMADLLSATYSEYEYRRFE